MASRLLGAAAFLLLASCQVFGADTRCANQIDWVDFIQVGTTQYVAGPGSATPLQESDLGPAYAKVKFKVSGNVCDPNYKLKDGDAAYLDPGDTIYEVKGSPPTERLAARRGGQLVLYLAVAQA
jgi:hypothetical protein